MNFEPTTAEKFIEECTEFAKEHGASKRIPDSVLLVPLLRDEEVLKYVTGIVDVDPVRLTIAAEQHAANDVQAYAITDLSQERSRKIEDALLTESGLKERFGIKGVKDRKGFATLSDDASKAIAKLEVEKKAGTYLDIFKGVLPEVWMLELVARDLGLQDVRDPLYHERLEKRYGSKLKNPDLPAMNPAPFGTITLTREELKKMLTDAVRDGVKEAVKTLQDQGYLAKPPASSQLSPFLKKFP